MIIFCYSPNYLRALFTESRDFRFQFQGYGSLDMCREGLVKTNISEIQGFIILVDSIAEDSERIREFIRKCDVLCDSTRIRKRLVIGVNNSSGLIHFLKGCRIENLEVYYSEFDIVTDTFIRQDLFGTILTSTSNPFDPKSVANELVPTSPIVGLKYVPFLPTPVMRVLDPLNVKSTLQDTVSTDSVLDQLSQYGELYVQLRLYYISRYFPQVTFDDSRLNTLLSEITDPDVSIRMGLLKSYLDQEGL